MSSSQQDYFDKYARGNQREQTAPQTYEYTGRRNQFDFSRRNQSNAFSSGNQQGQQRPQTYEIEARKAQREGDLEGYLKWSSALNNENPVSGSTDYTQLSNLKDAIFQLKNHYFNPNSGLSVQGTSRDELSRRFLLVEHQIEGLLRRRIDYRTKDHVEGERSIDYAVLLSEKQSKILELQRKIDNLEERLRRSAARQIELQNRIVAFKAQFLSSKGLSGSRLQDAIHKQQQYDRAQREVQQLRQTLSAASGIWLKQLSQYKSKYPKQNWQLDVSITQRLRSSNIKSMTVNQHTFIEVHSDKTVEVPVQDVRTKRLVQTLTKHFKKLTEKYPKLKAQLSEQLSQLYSQEIIDVIEVDGFDRLVEIVKFIPQSVRVENTYTYSSSKSRRVQFHLRILVKALLEELQKIKLKTGAVLQIDEGVLGMIREEIIDIVDVDDILSVFRVVPKVVEVEKVVQKIVQRMVQVPQIVTVQKYIDKIIQVPKYVQVQKVIHKPVEVIKVVDSIVERYVQVPTIEQKVVQVPVQRQIMVPVCKQVPKLIQVQKIIKQIVVDTKYVQIQKPINHIVYVKQIVQVIRQVQVPVETIRQVIKQVQVIVQKIVPIEVIKVEVVEVEKVIEKIIKETCYQPVTQNQVAIKEVIVEVPVYIEKIIPVETIVTKIKPVPEYIEVPVPIRETKTQLKVVQLSVEKVVERIVPRQIEKIVTKVVQKEVQRIRQVQRIVQVPILQDRIVTVPIDRPVIVIEKVHVPHVVPIKCIQQKIIQKPKIIQIEKPYIQYIKDIEVVNCTVEKIVEVPRIVERIKEVKCMVEKIVNKLVEVPKVVEVEKIVERIVVVPRVVETLVQVPKIVEVTVQKIVQVPKVIQVQRLVEKIVYRDRPVQVQKIKNVFIDVDRPVQVCRQIPVVAQKIIEKKQVIEVPFEKIVTVNKEVPVDVYIDKIIPVTVDNLKIVQIEKPTTLIVQVPKVIDRKIEVPVEVVNTVVQEVHLVKTIKVPVQVQVVKTQLKEVEKCIEKVVAVSEPKIYTQTKVVVNQKFTPVTQQIRIPVKVPSSVPASKPQIVDRLVQKVVQCKVQFPKVISVELLKQIPVQRTKVVELDKVINYIQTQHKIVEVPVDRIVTAPTYEQYAVQNDIVREKVVEVKTEKNKLQMQDRLVEKIVESQKFTTVTDKVPYYESRVETVERYQKVQVPTFTTQEKIVQVPQFQQKIFERIVIMPQIVQVFKHVTQICQIDDLAVGVSVNVLEQEKRYKQLYGVTKQQIQIVISELRQLKRNQPHLSGMIELLERYLVDFDRLAALQRIVAVEKEKIVEKEVNKPIIIPTQDSQSKKTELAHAVLIQKLVAQLRRLKKENSSLNFKLDNDITLVFFNELQSSRGSQSAGGNFQQQLNQYTTEVLRKLKTMGGTWASDHQLMLSTILQERFTMASTIRQANIQIQRANAISQQHSRAFKQIQNRWLPLHKIIQQQHQRLKNLLQNNPSLRGYPDLVALCRELERLLSQSNLNFQPLLLLDSHITTGTGANWNRALSRINQLQMDYAALVVKLLQAEKNGSSLIDTASQATIKALREENQKLSKEITSVRRSTSMNNSQTQELRQTYQNKLRQSTTNIESIQSQLVSTQNKVQEYQLQNKTIKSKVADLESQIRTSNLRIQELQSQLKTAKETIETQASKMQHSRRGSEHQSANYASNSGMYSDTSAGARMKGNLKHASSYLQPGGAGYTTGGTSAYQGATSGYKQLSSSGLQGMGMTQAGGTAGGRTQGLGRPELEPSEQEYGQQSPRQSKKSSQYGSLAGSEVSPVTYSNYTQPQQQQQQSTVSRYGTPAYTTTTSTVPHYSGAPTMGASVTNVTRGGSTNSFTTSISSATNSFTSLKTNQNYTFQTKR